VNFERDENQNLFTTFFSGIILSVALFLFYSFKGEPGDADTLYRLSNLKSMVELGELRHPYEPLPTISFYLIHKILGLKLMSSYQLALTLSISAFLHLAMLCFREKVWKLNNYFIIYFIASLPFTLYLPYQFYEELLCVCILLGLHFRFRLQNIPDLLKLIFFSSLAFLSHLPAFIFGYLVFVGVNTYKTTRENRSKTTVFFKKKNIPLRLFFTYLGILSFIVAFMSLGDFYGPSTFKYLMKEFWEIIFRFGSTLFMMMVAEYLLRSEKELNTKGTTAVVMIMIAMAGYFSFKASFESSEALNHQKDELLKLKTKGRILTGENTVYVTRPFSDFVYFSVSENLPFRAVFQAKPTDYINFTKIENQDLAYFDKKSIGYGSYYILDTENVIVRKDLVDKILNDPQKPETFDKIRFQLEQFDSKPNPVVSFHKGLNKLFGF
jgi:hypothetical protein